MKPFSVSYLQYVFIQTFLRHFLFDIVVGAEFEREVSQMIGCDPNGHRDDVALAVSSGDDASAVLSTGFVGTWTRIAEGVSADSASSMVKIVLDLEHNASVIQKEHL